MKMRKTVTSLVLMTMLLTACGGNTAMTMETVNSAQKPDVVEDKYRTTYEVFVYSFADSDGDGIGDIQGLRDKLDYINDGKYGEGNDLECNEIWLMPICPSPSYHKYDVTDYEDIDPEYGTMEDFEGLISDCHERGIRVILDTVMNHSSSEHPWFKEACEYIRSLGADDDPDPEACPYVAYYNFNRLGMTGYSRVPGTDWFYESRFVDTMPDMNLDNPAVRQEFADIAKFWLDKGADGFRLDAVTSYYTDHDDQNIEYLKWFADTVHGMDEDAYIVGEAWSGLSSYAPYYKSGTDSFFDFASADNDGNIAKAVRGSMKAESFGLAMQEKESTISDFSSTAINAPFTSNHDMGRVAGYFAGDDGSMTKLAGGLCLMSAGNAFIYYGEELGMKGSGRDENKRAPMQWSSDPSGEYMTSGPSAMEKVEMKFPALDEQLQDEDSIYNYYRQAVRIRNNYPVIARGKTHVNEELSDDNVLVITREADGYEPVTIVFNLSEEACQVTWTDSAPDKVAGLLLATGMEGLESTGRGRSRSEESDADKSETGEEEKDEVTYKDGTLSIPSRGIVVLK